MKKNDHIPFETLLDYHDNKLDKTGRQEVASHLADCSECTALHDKIKTGDKILASMTQAHRQEAYRRLTNHEKDELVSRLKVAGDINRFSWIKTILFYIREWFSPATVFRFGAQTAFVIALILIVNYTTRDAWFHPDKLPVNFKTKGGPTGAFRDGSGWTGQGITRQRAKELQTILAQTFHPGWRRWALVVGISKYRDTMVSPLSSAVTDAERILQMLRQQMRVPETHLLHLQNRTATEAALRAALVRLSTDAGPEDQVFVYFSSHGILGADGSLHLRMYDTLPGGGGISLQDVNRLLAPIRGRVAIFLDTCYSGNIPLTGFTLPKDRWVFSASASDTPAFTSPEASLFTDALLKGLSGAADKNSDNIVSLKEAYMFTQENLSVQGKQSALLEGNGDPANIVLSMAPALWNLAPVSGSPSDLTSSVKLAMPHNPTGGVIRPRILLDGKELGPLSGTVATLPLAPGVHNIMVHYSGAFSPAFSPRDISMWRTSIEAVPGKCIEFHVDLAPPMYQKLSIASVDGGFFPNISTNPAIEGIIRTRWTSSRTLEISIMPSSGVMDQEYSISFGTANTDFAPVNVAALLQTHKNERMVVQFMARSKEKEVPVTFTVGDFVPDNKRDSGDSIMLSSQWKEYSLPIDSSIARALASALRVRVSPSVGPVVLVIRDLRIVKTKYP